MVWPVPDRRVQFPISKKGCRQQDLKVHRRRTTPVAWRHLLRKITPARIVAAVVLLTAFYLLLTAFFEFFQYLPYFRFILLCVMGFSFLVITFLLNQ